MLRVCARALTPYIWLLGSIAPDGAELLGTIKDAQGGAVTGARVVVMTPQRAVVATGTTDQAGKYSLTGLAEGQVLVVAQYPGLADKSATVTLVNGKPTTLDLVLEVAPLGQEVTVTAAPGSIETLARTAQPVNIVSSDDMLARVKTVIAQAVDGETGVNLQRTSPGMAGIFVRGLTGNKVNVFIDGVRFSNGAQRGGVNTFLDLIDQSTVESLEVLRGTTSAQYGSDALGGSLQFLTNVAPLSSTGKPSFSGSVAAGGETAHQGGFGSAGLNYSRPRFALSGSVSGRKVGDYRPGSAQDSHAAVLRFLGLQSDVLYPDRMPDTGFHQTATQVRSNWIATPTTSLVVNYIRTRQDGANRWDQMLGGDGNLVAALNDLQMDLVYARLETAKAGWFDHASATYSFNTQREERVNQGGNGNPNALIAHEPERTTVNGVQGSLSKRLSPRHTLLVGGDAYFEGLTSVSFDENPATGAQTVRRPRVPDGATYKQIGGFGQVTADLVDNKLTVIGAARVGYNAYKAQASDAPVVNGKPLWPDDSLDVTSFTFRIGGAYTPVTNWTVTSALSRGYRAPHMTDLGTLGLTGSGFEVSAPDLAGREAFVGSTADANAVSTGHAVEQLTPETSLNFDADVRYTSRRARFAVGMFVNNIDGNIQKQTLIMAPGAVGQTLGTEVITSQNANGAVFVAASTSPVLVRANFDHARIWGFESSGEANLTNATSFGITYTYLHAIETTTDVPPNIEGGTPAPGGMFWVRYMTPGSKWWVQPYLYFAGTQSNLSSLDLSDRRTGATRSRTNIQNFFRNGARARGWINPGTDGTFGTADDILIATGETLAQVQDRVLGVGVNSAPLYTSVASYAVFGIRFGVNIGQHKILVDAENLTDESYRGISWGMDGPGRGLTVRYLLKF